MPDTFTPTINLAKPEVGASRDAWGGKWNGNADALDDAIKADRASIKAVSDKVDGLQAFPAGALSYFAMAAPPTGWLKCNGAAVSRTTYAALFAAIGTTFGAGDGSTTFNLPDVRGYFMRALDDGRGVDAGRGIGSIQADQNLSHVHSIGPSNSVYYGSLYNNGQPDYAVGQNPGVDYGARFMNASGGAEARPKNIAFPLFIKY